MNRKFEQVRVYDVRRGRRLVAAIEIVSPANKDRLEHRRAFVAQCSALLQQRVAVALVDLVTTRHFNLYGDLLELMGQRDPSLEPEAPALYAPPAGRLARTGHGWSKPGSTGWRSDNRCRRCRCG